MKKYVLELLKINFSSTARLRNVALGTVFVFFSLASCGNQSESAESNQTSKLYSEADVMSEEAAEAEYSEDDRVADFQQQANLDNMNSELKDESGVEFTKVVSNKNRSVAPSTTNNPVNGAKKALSTLAASQNPGGRKLITTSNLRFRVGDVFESTQQIESLALKNGGFIMLSDLTSRVDYNDQVRISKDSSMHVDYISCTSKINIRVPAGKLADFLSELAPMVDYLDTRNIAANDVTLTLLGNELLKQRTKKHNARLGSKITSSKNLSNIVYAEQQLLAKEEQSDLALISNLQLEDQIAFTTISMDVYQPQVKKYKLVKDTPEFKRYEVPFTTRVVKSLDEGLDGLVSFILFMLSGWQVFLILIIIANFLLGGIGLLTTQKR